MTGFQGSGSERKFQSSIDQIMEAKPEGAVSSLQERLRELNIGYNATQQPPDKVLEELTVEGVVKHIQELKGQNSESRIRDVLIIASLLFYRAKDIGYDWCWDFNR